MSLDQELRNALAGTAPFANGDATLEAHEGDKRFICRLVSLDRLGCACQSVRLQAGSLAGVSIERLKDVSQELSARVNYLLEPIAPLEVDAERCLVQMRSNPPQRNDDQRTYYELLVARGGEISLQRYQTDGGNARVAVPLEVTREVLLRLARDFAAVC